MCNSGDRQIAQWGGLEPGRIKSSVLQHPIYTRIAWVVPSVAQGLPRQSNKKDYRQGGRRC